MSVNNLDAIMATSPANVFYSSDLCPYGTCFSLLTADGGEDAALVAPISGTTPIVLMSPPWISDIRYYGEFYNTTLFAGEPLSDAERKLVEAQASWEKSKARDPVALLIGLFKERGITKGRIGIDETNLSPDHPFWKRAEAELPALVLVPARNIFSEMRLVKSEEELRRIKRAVQITEKAWDAALSAAGEGMTERSFCRIYESAVLSEGGVVSSKMGYYGSPIAFGRRTEFVDIALPSESRLVRGDVIRLDGGCGCDGYPCDMGRSAVLGDADQKTMRYWKALFRGESLAIEQAKPGVKASDLFDSAVTEVRKAGINHYRRHHTGHSWGIEGYEPFLIEPSNGRELEEGMVLCIETPYYEVGWGGLLHEDVVRITEDGSEYITAYEDELRRVG